MKAMEAYGMLLFMIELLQRHPDCVTVDPKSTDRKREMSCPLHTINETGRPESKL